MSQKNLDRDMPNKGRRDEALNELEKTLRSRERRAKAAPLGVIFATLAVLVLLVGGIYMAVTWNSDEKSTEAADQTSSEQQTPEAAAMPDKPLEPYGQTVKCEYKKDGKAAKPVSAPNGDGIATTGTQKVIIKTNEGDIPLEVDAAQSPCTVNSFVHLVEAKFFDNTVCHRSVKSVGLTILQCGDPTAKGNGGPGYRFANEFPENAFVKKGEKVDPMNPPEGLQKPVKYPRGSLAMANTGQPETNGSQFFLVDQDSTLPPTYNMFGKITDEGLKTLDKILEKAPQDDGKPKDEVRITSATKA
ncbi:peptidylprolyl isomerase [Corynebacterium auriscanis]|uniref:peptidylprolyl isomerase n=1 Tax=Corynebacterium auriscanis TaxID=99807 RepID=UPI003CFB6333